jgi:hypothetical protein
MKRITATITIILLCLNFIITAVPEAESVNIKAEPENDPLFEDELIPRTAEDDLFNSIDTITKNNDKKNKQEKKENKVKFDPLKSTREGKYKSHLLTKEEVKELKKNIGVRDPDQDYNIIIDGYGTGFAPPTEEEWDAMVGNIEYVESTYSLNLPGKIDHSQSDYFPQVRTQGKQGSCASWAVTYYTHGYLQAKDNDFSMAKQGYNEHLMNPGWTYNKANYGVNKGSHCWTNYYVLRDVGCAKWSTMPYNDSDYSSWGSEDAWREAMRYRAADMKMIKPKNIDIIKSWVNDGYVVPGSTTDMWFPWYSTPASTPSWELVTILLHRQNTFTRRTIMRIPSSDMMII